MEAVNDKGKVLTQICLLTIMTISNSDLHHSMIQVSNSLLQTKPGFALPCQTLCSNQFCITIKCSPSSMLSLALRSTNSMLTFQPAQSLLRQATLNLFVLHSMLQLVTNTLPISHILLQVMT